MNPARRSAVDVYLDSQDYSRLASSRPESVALLKALTDLREAGHARYLFSDVLLFECLPTDPEEPAEGLARIATMADLTLGANLPSAGNLMDFELNVLLAQASGSRRVPRLSPNWFSDFEWDDDPMRRVQSELKGSLRATPGLTRNQRRAAVKHANREAALKTRSEWMAAGLGELQQKYPIRPRDEARLIQALGQHAPTKVLQNIILDAVRDISNFAQWVVRNWDAGRVFVDGLRAPGMNMRAQMIDFFDRMQSLHAQAAGTLASGRLARLVEGTFQDWLARVPRQRLLARGTVGADLIERIPPISMASTPSLYATHDFYSRVMMESARAGNARNPNKRKASDFADGLHALYLPRVDVFRADRFAASLLRRSPALGATVVCESLEDLPSLIESLAEKRAI